MPGTDLHFNRNSIHLRIQSTWVGGTHVTEITGARRDVVGLVHRGIYHCRSWITLAMRLRPAAVSISNYRRAFRATGCTVFLS